MSLISPMTRNNSKTARPLPAADGLNELSIRDKELFSGFLAFSRHELSAYAFENIYVWKCMYDIFWKVSGKSLCVFFRDKTGCFMYLPPLGESAGQAAIEACFKVMDEFNGNRDFSRIENVEGQYADFCRGLGYRVDYKSCDYTCGRQELVDLRGDRFKSKRANCNYFTKHYNFEYLPYSAANEQECLRLYCSWMEQRKQADKGSLYGFMLSDSLHCLKALLGGYKDLGATGRLVMIDGAVRAFSFGLKLNSDTFCILYEVADLRFKGIAQFVFRSFCAELKDYRYINTMDDLGLENLKSVKLSYQPVKTIPSYIVKRT